jgi:hypothetical protein
MRVLIILFIIILTSCKSESPKEKIPLLSGYWEIEKVTLKDGTVKEFTINTTIDFIEIQDSIGIRKKVSPKLDGTFTTFNQIETFTIEVDNNLLILIYKTPYTTWKEKVLEINKQMLLVENEDEKVYQYKRYIPINLK